MLKEVECFWGPYLPNTTCWRRIADQGGFYVKHDDQIYQGQEILHGLFGKNAFIESFILIVELL